MPNPAPSALTIFGLLLLLVGGCASVPQIEEERISVIGEVTVRGQQPFSEYVLVTEEGNFYVLDFPDESAESVSTPARLEVTGRLHRDVWEGRPYAHIEVAEWKRP